MPSLGLGIDTGGTFTDSVIVDLDTGRVLCSSKAPTTREDLSVGVRGSLEGLDGDLLRSVSLTSLSSTLATNSVVEGKGCRAGMICIGKSYDVYPHPECYAEVNGSFSMNGEETERLDVKAVKAALKDMVGRIDALAVAGYLSVRNPDHELRVAAMAKEILGVPVVCTHVLTSRLGFAQRATTALMNARLIPVIADLLASVRKVMTDLGITSPLMIVKGDGALMKDDEAALRPVETILSGPASSMIGAMALTGLKDAVVIDVGGTTSDIGILKDGRPRIEPEGALIGGHRTRVMAADVSTFGIGGDSRMVVNGREVILSPVRVIPLCFAATKWPVVKEKIHSLQNVTDDRAADTRSLEKVVQDTEFFTLAHHTFEIPLDEVNKAFMELVSNAPVRICDAAEILDVHPNAISAGMLESLGYVTRIGFTPTDLLHAEGTFTEFDTEVSEIAAGYLARRCHKSTGDFIRDARQMVTSKIARCVMEKVLLDGTGRDEMNDTEAEIVSRCLSSPSDDYGIGFTLKSPLVGIGAPVGAWLPQVADTLGTKLVITEESEIGNAVGAVTGSVSETAEVTVRAVGDELVDEPECNVFTGETVKTFARPREALEYARTECARKAVEAARRAGASNPVVEVSVDERSMEVSAAQKIFRGALVTARATGKPDLH